jgi:hypothetical protein
VKRRFLAPPAASAARASRVASASRAARVIAGTAAVAALASGCAVFSPIGTDSPYAPADGVPANVGELAIRNLVLVGTGSGKLTVSGSAINLGTSTLTVQFQAQPSDPSAAPAGGSEVTLKPREQIDLATKGLVLEGVTTKPGYIVPVMVVSSQGGTTIVNAPLLPPTGYYTTVTPPVAPATPTPAP